MRKLGASFIGRRTESGEEQIRAFAEAGFQCFFTGYGSNEPIEKWAELGAKLGLSYETIHSPYSDINTFWEDGVAGDDYLVFLRTRVDGCVRAGVPVMVMHTTRFTSPPPISALGLDRFRRLNDYARDRGVRLAYENIENPEYLAAVMEITGDEHGFCWDCGHNYCYTPMIDMMAFYGNRLLCTHIHDNFGLRTPGLVHYRDDFHLLPFDGGLYWEEFASRIRQSGYQGPLTLEMSCKTNQGERDMPLMEYVLMGYERACRLRSMVDDPSGKEGE